MATLEKIRSKSVLLLIIVGAALLAFIIGDFFTSGRTLFGTGTTLATVGGQKVDVQEFQRRVQLAQQQEQQQGRSSDGATLQQRVLNDMIADKLFEEEINKLGITVTDNELTEMMVGKNAQYVNQMVQSIGFPDGATFHDMAYNPGKYNLPQEQALQMQQYWLEMESNIEKMLLQQKFQNLFAGTLTANDLDARAIYDDMASTANVVYAKKDLSTVPDDDFKVEDADVQKIYNSEKEQYKIDEPTRLVNYIAVNIVPSEADVLAGQQAVENALLALNTNEGAQGLSELSAFVVENRKLSQAELDAQASMKAALDTLSVGRASLVERTGNDYTIAKLLNKSQASDKVKLDFFAVQGTRYQVDSLTRLLNGGAPFDSIAASPLVAQSQQATEISLLDPNSSMVSELIEGQATGTWFAPDTLPEGGRIIRIVERAAPTTVYDMAVATYTVEPSNATVNALEAKLQDYVNGHKTAKEFVDSAQACGFTTFPAYVTPSSPSIGNLTDSHSAVSWTMDAKKGQVSPVFGDIQSGRFLAVAVDDIYDGYRPASDPQLSNQLKIRALNEKKAAKLLADYEGKAKDVAGYAAVMGAQADTTTVNFSQFVIPGIGINESAVMGRVSAAKPGQLIGPMKANNSVVVLEVVNIDNEGRPYSYDESAMRYNQQRGSSRLVNNLPLILVGKNKIKNNMTKFYK
ncbi:MAG: SurA N-terminal domain-containing protein [Muribaculaceae bacterium]|nr:SurA N-terminal domain-containing protein [Muribaculaceae bacterium]